MVEGGRRITAAPTRSMPAMAVLAVRAEVVGHDVPAVGPRDQHRAVELQLLDHRGEVVGPEPRVDVVPASAASRTCRDRGCRR